MPKGSSSIPRLTGDAPPLIFGWRPVRGVKRRLAAWLFVVAAGHAALFYLFRVAPPVVSRPPPPQQSVVYLPPADSGVRALLSMLDDRYPGALLRPGDYTLKADMEALAKITPPAEPSWATHRTELKPFPQPLVPQELPGLFVPGMPLLPESGEHPPLPAASGATRSPVPSVIVEEDPGKRTIVQPPVWPEKIVEEMLPPGGNVRFLLGVDGTGKPEFCMPPSSAPGLSPESQEALRARLMEMRFNEKTGGIEWITVAVRW